jgi:microcystin degradation protein MlrC
MNAAETIALGAAAKQALDVLDPALDAVRADIVKRLIATAPADTATILGLHAAIQATNATRQMICEFIANGQIAEHHLSAGE